MQLALGSAHLGRAVREKGQGGKEQHKHRGNEMSRIVGERHFSVPWGLNLAAFSKNSFSASKNSISDDSSCVG